jgi:endonuclease/exonuclease/phosphatase family metal-dependent hydrolase
MEKFLKNRSFKAGIVLLLVVSLWLTQVSVPGSTVLACLEGCSTGIPAHPQYLRVVSFNMLHGFPNFSNINQRLEIISSEIERLDVDVALMQEVPWTLRTGFAAQKMAERTGMNYAFLRAAGDHWTILFEEGELILSRYPIEEIRRIVLKPKPVFFENRVALAGKISINGDPIWLVSTHLTTSDGAPWDGQADSLGEFVASLGPEPALVGGDFNHDPAEVAKRLGWLDPQTLLQIPGSVETNTCCLDGGTLLDERIDAVLLTTAWNGSGWMIQSMQRIFDTPFPAPAGSLWASDHAGVIVELVPISPPGIQSSPAGSMEQ